MAEQGKSAESTSASDAEEAGLVYVWDSEPGISRRRAGRGFCYRYADGKLVREKSQLGRIRALAVPPAYTDVWICRSARGHLQATGRDARGRKQYRYHPSWQTVRDQNKFCRLPDFARRLPRLRRRLGRDLKLAGYPREKVLALAVSILAETLVRVGNDKYARSNRSYGLSTLRNRHVDFVRGGRARLHFTGKGGKRFDVELGDARLVKLVRACQELPGQALFQYRDDEGDLQPVSSGDVNAYLREAMGDDFTAKDFRTWGGTALAFRLLAEAGLPAGSRLAGVRKQVVREVADMLGNTPAVCRKAYIDPVVFDGWESGELARFAEGARGRRQWEVAARRFLEASRRGSAPS